MEIRTIISNVNKIRFFKRQPAKQSSTVTDLTNLTGRFEKLQAYVRDNFLQLLDSVKAYKGNAYNTYAGAVSEIDKKYKGVADWGVAQTGAIVDLRAAFIVGDGITVSPATVDDEAEKEIEWVEEFLKYNDLDREIVQEFAKEAEIEGKIALKIAIEKDKDSDKDSEEGKEKWAVSVRFISWLRKKYEVIPNPKDYLDYQKLKWKAGDGYDEETLEAKEFVYKKFGGRIMDPNEAAPKVMKCLTQIEALDKAIRDWREINHIFAGPILYFKCLNKEEVRMTKEAVDDTNFKLKKIFIGTAEASFIPLDIKGVESIEREIESNLKVISGDTGIPVHFLGFADLMKNRSTAENLMEMINAATTKERQIWIGVYEEVITKAMTMWNDSVKQGIGKEGKLDPKKIKVDIPIITQEHYDRIEKIYLPACIAGKLSDEALVEMLPNVDAKTEKERREKKEASELEETRQSMRDMQSQDLGNNPVTGRPGAGGGQE